MPSSATTAAVDLSRLPAPTVVEPLSYEVILAQMVASLVELDATFTGLVESDPAMKALEVAAARELLLRQRVNDAARAVMLAFARGADLEHLAALYEVQRLQLTPGDPLTGVAPTYESDDDLLERTQLAPEGFSVAGPEGAYRFHARSADPDVLDASAFSPAPGEVVVTVLSRTGTGEAGAPLLAAVEAALSAEDVRPLTDEVTVQSAEILEYAVVAQIYTYPGPDQAVVLAAANARLDAYTAANHRLGRNATRSGINAALFVEGVQRAVITTPAADVVADNTQATYCTGRTVTAAGVDE